MVAAFPQAVAERGSSAEAQYYEFLSVRERVTLEGELIRAAPSFLEWQRVAFRNELDDAALSAF